ncbi:MAG: PaaI family thioesterase [Blastocatellia bacterium]|nr:PaaI family thioesterase [Blastocatellia bacterium]
MTDKSSPAPGRANPFGELIGLTFSRPEQGRSLCVLEVREELMNPNGILHGGVVYSMADTGMGAALHTLLPPDEMCATIEIKIVYLRTVTSGTLRCETRVIQKGSRIAVVESEVMNDDRLVAKALGTFSILKRIRESSAE